MCASSSCGVVRAVALWRRRRAIIVFVTLALGTHDSARCLGVGVHVLVIINSICSYCIALKLPAAPPSPPPTFLLPPPSIPPSLVSVWRTCKKAVPVCLARIKDMCPQQNCGLTTAGARTLGRGMPQEPCSRGAFFHGFPLRPCAGELCRFRRAVAPGRRSGRVRGWRYIKGARDE